MTEERVANIPESFRTGLFIRIDRYSIVRHDYPLQIIHRCIFPVVLLHSMIVDDSIPGFVLKCSPLQGRVNLNAVFGPTVMSDDEGDHIHHGARML